MPDKILSIKNLSVSFHPQSDVWALDQVSFDLKNGKTTALIGASGSGKSLTSLAIMGLLPNNATSKGEIIFNKQNLLKTDNQLIESIRGKEISMVFQEPMTALNPIQTCGKQLTEAILVHQKISFQAAKEKAVEWLANVQLPQPEAIFHRYPHQLSGGQKQRIMIAMAMCNHPKLLIADEPTTALDVVVQADIIRLMKSLQEQFKMSMLFITHDLALAQLIADEFIVIDKGKIQENIVPEHFLKNRINPVDKANNSLLQVKNLSVIYKEQGGIFSKNKKEVKAVNKVSFSIHHGETLGLVGESGCGKSTLGKTLLGLQKAHHGSILFQNQDITQYNDNQWKKLRKEIQIVFQDPYASLNPRIRIGDAIMEPMYVHKTVDKDKMKVEMENLLQQVDLPLEAQNKYPHEFSGGQRQRICIARALALKPKLIICDESVSALDFKTQEQILSLLQKLQKEYGLTYLFISHDLKVVQSFCNRVLVMNKGEIVESGVTGQILSNPENEYTKKLIDAIP